MICDHCKKKPATVHYTEIINNNFTQINLCQDCVRKKGIGIFNIKPDVSFTDFLEGFDAGSPASAAIEVAQEGAGRDLLQAKSTLVCRACGISYAEFKKAGILGCSACYDSFKKQLLPLVRHIHGSNRHVGRGRPRQASQAASTVNLQDELKHAKAQLTQAIQKEAFEEAARLRDYIKLLEEEVKKNV